MASIILCISVMYFEYGHMYLTRKDTVVVSFLYFIITFPYLNISSSTEMFPTNIKK